MSEGNVEIVRGVYERWREGDFRATLDVIDPWVIGLENFRERGEALEAAGMADLNP